MYLEEGKILNHEALGGDQYLIELICPRISAKASPGQFVHLSCHLEGSRDPLLRRPLSIHSISAAKKSISLYYAAVGRGTRLLAKSCVGDPISIMGPLGNGFDLNPQGQRAVLVGGGMGAAPLLALAQRLSADGKQVAALLGAASAVGHARSHCFDKYADVIKVTEDGSQGKKGLVTDFLTSLVIRHECTVYACGPLAMLREVSRICCNLGVSCQVSLEASMACGLGACLGCTGVADRHGNYPKVCKDGPVFWAEEVEL